ncbi:GtrA family protein [Cellulomonas xiejunii]|uniref:GtrA family protein n=1 Tax=Cellulomonas xiejunii TaxID=2968083 RepID=A0ABY5KJ78_9CELL|nr:GtrA family protein [Cellulomonas xiejunii]MCC2312905.1 GtrA family protein [Cellulomonas xiejunii]MCC2320225.1 GtrA family protein [Cellulomonas xiejunii]UUI70532.1 GtrA family protein [Cellulomonas xiejunii]
MTGAPLAMEPAQDRTAAGARGRVVDRVRPLLTPQFVRFVLVGGVNTLFGFGLFALLQATLGQVWHYLLVTVVSHVFAVLEAFLMQRYVVFKVRDRFLGDLWRFSGVYVVVLVANLVVLPLLHDVVGLSLLVAQGLFMALSAVCTFTVHRLFTFRRPGARDVSAVE